MECRTIRELCELVVDCPHSTPVWTDNGKIVIRNQYIKNGRIDFSAPSYTDEIHYLQRIKRAKPMAGDIVITREAPMGDVGMIPEGIECCLGQRMVLLRVKPEICDKYYLLYSLQSRYVQHQISWSEGTGTTVSNLRIPHLEQLKIPYVSLTQQRKISSILRSIDAKIETNRKINDNLLQQIKLLVSSWLVDYVPFGGVMPNDWHTISLSSIANFVSGYSYKGTELQPSTTAMATIKNFDRNGGFKLDGFKELIPSTKIKPYHYAEKFDVVVAHTDLTQKAEVIGNAEPIINLAGYDSIVFSMDLVKVVPKNTNISKFMIAALLQNPRFKSHCLGYVNGTTVLHLSKKALPDYELDFPVNPAVLDPLDDALRALYMQMATIVDENRKLQELRDTLLPGLMSGDIDISKIAI